MGSYLRSTRLIYLTWNESFQLLYTFKAEVETASPGSVVEIDKHTVKYKLKGSASGGLLFVSRLAGRGF